jgi:hypothetical protein
VSIFTASYEVPNDADARTIDVLANAGLRAEVTDDRYADAIGTIIVVTTWSDDESAEAQLAYTERIEGLLSEAHISFRLRESGLGGRFGANRRVLLDGQPIPIVTGTGRQLFHSIYWTSDDDAEVLLRVIAKALGVPRARLSLDPGDDPFLGLFEDE